MLMFKLKVLLRSLFGEGVWSVVQRLSFTPRHRLARLVQRETGRTVRSGPFAGVHYLHDAVSGGYIPKLLGIYERELHPVIASLPQHDIRSVINIGASDGYYAVGLARCLPAARVVAFEMEPRGQDFVRRIADNNDVGDRVTVYGRCDLPDLQSAAAGLERPLVICDVEGYEDVLLDPENVPALHSAWILVELHDGKNPNVSDRIRARFEKSHQIETILQTKRTAADFPFANAYTRSLAAEYLAAAVDEGRPVRNGITPMSWFWMVPMQG
jgi:hypothetical protein